MRDLRFPGLRPVRTLWRSVPSPLRAVLVRECWWAVETGQHLHEYLTELICHILSHSLRLFWLRHVAGMHIGAHARILPNLTIGEGSVVAAGAVVTDDVPAYMMVAGVPARNVRRRSRDLHYELDFRKPFG